MELQGNKSHWHEGYQIPHNDKIYQTSMLPSFPSLVEPLTKLGITVWNACPTSKLDCFPKCTIEQSLLK